MAYNICVLPGDGIGPEIMEQGLKVLQAVGDRFNLEFSCDKHLLGGCAIDACGDPFPEETRVAAKAANAVLLAAVGGPKWDSTNPDARRPEEGLLGIRKELDLFANIRPIHVFPPLVDASSLKPESLEDVDLVIVREATGGLYFGAHGRELDVPGAGSDGKPGMAAFDALDYNEGEIERIARSAFQMARSRGKRLHSVDKANVLETSRLWRQVMHRVGEEFPDVELIDMLVDNAAMQLVAYPAQFDVLVTENTFGDILSDEAAALTGSLGMVASASLGPDSSLYEPAHGSAPDIAGKGLANPLAMILSVELMLRYSFEADAAANAILVSINRVLAAGYRTPDLADTDTPADHIISCSSMGGLVAANL